MMNELSIIVLAAGKGTRMKSAKPKVLQTLAGFPLLGHVLRTINKLKASHTFLVYGFGGEEVKQNITSLFAAETLLPQSSQLHWIEQVEQLGTGHAVQMTLNKLPKTGKSLILYGDVPLIGESSLNRLLMANQAGMSMLTLNVANPFGLGRIKRNEQGKILAIVEQKDATAQEQAITEINSGIYCVDNELLHRYLPKLSNDNAQDEYYLTDIVKMAVDDGIDIVGIEPDHAFEIEGVNDRMQLANLERTYQSHQVQALQKQGVQFADPMRVDIRGQLTVGQDVFVDVGVVFEGDCTLGDNVYIEAGCVIKDSQIGNATHLKPYCVLDKAKVGAGVDIGPFAHLRPDSELADNSKIGNFVETKKAKIGKGSKVNHLSYIGDAIVGVGVNVGAGTITCNYDGANKHLTQIGNHAFIGSNTSLVAPICIGDGATVGAGSTISKDVPDNALAVARGRQVEKENWQRPIKKNKSAN